MKKCIFWIFLCLCLCSCSQKSELILSNGYNSLVFNYNINVSTELNKEDLSIVISNYNRINYRLWVIYKYKGKTKSGNSKELLYEGDEFKKVVLVTIPKEKELKQSIEVKINDENGNIIYDSPLIEKK